MNVPPRDNTDYGNQVITSSVVCKSQGKTPSSTQPEISMKHFLDFLATAYRLNDTLENYPFETLNKCNRVDWTLLNSCNFVSVLFLNNIVDTNIQKGCDHDCYQEEGNNRTLSKPYGMFNNLPYYNFQKCDLSKSERGDDESKYIVKQSVKRGEKHKRGRSASLTGSTLNAKGEKNRLEKRRGSFAKREHSENKNKSHNDISIAERQVKQKLGEVLQEGILDSVLPYVVPKQHAYLSAKKSLPLGEKKNGHEKSSSSSSGQIKENISPYHSKKQSTFMTDSQRDVPKDIEVEIHVCDEVKNMKKDFRCSQRLLVSKMGYFAEVTTGQNLQDMDISVHCDITIFEWLMRWVKRDPSQPELNPQLDAANVIPVLVSAAFLQMDPLLNDCLIFCQDHMNEILRQATNLSCLNDSIITRLATRFTNVEIEEMRDKRDKLQTRLFCKLITFLGEPEPDQKRGHFASLAYMFKCAHCHKLLPQNISPLVICQPSNNCIDSLGQVQGVHVRNPNWSVTEWIKQIRLELSCWRDIYWRLWGQSHWLRCSVCHIYYPVSQSDWCCYHPDSPQFFIMEQHRTMYFPIGRYPCCGERAYKFEVLQNSNGCTYRPHVPVVDSNVRFEIQNIYQLYRKAIALEPPHNVFQERLTHLVRSNRDGNSVENTKEIPNIPLWWCGLQLAPSSHKTVLISRIWEKPKEAKAKVNVHQNASMVLGPSGYPGTSGSSEKSLSSDDSERDSSPSLFGEDNSDDSLLCNSPITKTNKKNGSLIIYCPNQPNQWLACYSTRYNQDSLRDHEEWSLGILVNLLSRRHGEFYHHGAGRGRWGPNITPLGGTYVRLEAQWRESHMHLYQGNRVTSLVANPRGRSVMFSRSRPRSNLR